MGIEPEIKPLLSDKQIAFIHIDKQMYISQLFIDLRKFREQTKTTEGVLHPAAQVLLFFHLLKENLTGMNFKAIAEKTNYAQMTISRAAKKIAENRLCRIEGTKEKSIVFKYDGKTLWNLAQKYLQTPVKRIVYFEERIKGGLIYLTGYPALAYYTNIEGGENKSFAISAGDYNYLLKNEHLQFSERYTGLYNLEVWKYPPALLANGKCVDPLSLYLIMKNDDNERVQIELEKLISAIW